MEGVYGLCDALSAFSQFLPIFIMLPKLEEPLTTEACITTKIFHPLLERSYVKSACFSENSELFISSEVN